MGALFLLNNENQCSKTICPYRSHFGMIVAPVVVWVQVMSKSANLGQLWSFKVIVNRSFSGQERKILINTRITNNVDLKKTGIDFPTSKFHIPLEYWFKYF